jgi:galactokinase
MGPVHAHGTCHVSMVGSEGAGVQSPFLEERVDTVSTTIAAHRTGYGIDPCVVVRAPGRLNLIGEHIDYHRGPVLPMAIDRTLVLSASPSDGDRFAVRSLPLAADAAGSLRDAAGLPRWAAVLVHAAAALRSMGIEVNGVAITAGGDLPIGGGLSSSAAWIVSVTSALAELAGARITGDALALLVPEIERAAYGVPCGAMDPLAVIEGCAGCALAIEPATLSVEPIALPPALAFVLVDSGTRRRLDDGRYAERRRESEAAAAALGSNDLRDATMDQCLSLPAPLADRATHVVSEIARVGEAIAALREGDGPAFGALLDASHASLRDRYSVSSPALDEAVALAGAHRMAYGARLTGAGFGGCAVAAVAAEGVDQFVEEVGGALRERLGPAAGASRIVAVAGAEVILPVRRPLSRAEGGSSNK